MELNGEDVGIWLVEANDIGTFFPLGNLAHKPLGFLLFG